MDRITDAWKGLGRREQLLTVMGLCVVVVVTLMMVVMGGGSDDQPIVVTDPASTADPFAAVPQPEGDVIVSSQIADETAAAEEGTGTGVAGLTVSGGGGDVATAVDDDLAYLQAEADRNYVPDKVDDGVYQPPIVSNAVKAAGRDLEIVAAEYRACWLKAKEANADARGCLNKVLKFGIWVDTEMPRNGGITLTKNSSDGHRLDYVLMPPPQDDCRVLDEGKSCDAWTSK